MSSLINQNTLCNRNNILNKINWEVAVIDSVKWSFASTWLSISGVFYLCLLKCLRPRPHSYAWEVPSVFARKRPIEIQFSYLCPLLRDIFRNVLIVASFFQRFNDPAEHNPYTGLNLQASIIYRYIRYIMYISVSRLWPVMAHCCFLREVVCELELLWIAS